MKKINLKLLTMQNFKGSENSTYNFGDKKTNILGANATGKTTIADAFAFLLFDKDSAGASKFQARPLDSNGNQIDNVEISVAVSMDIDGKEIALKKGQKKKWVKRRGSQTQELQGNVNEYEINGYPKSEKEYKDYISSLIDESVFKLVTNPQAFPSLPWKEQREMLMKLSTGMSDFEISQDKQEFSELLSELEIATTDDIGKKYQKALSMWKDKQKELPARIDELSKQIGQIDVAELELQKNSLNEQISEKEKLVSDSDKQYEEHQKKYDNILQLKFKQSDMERSESEKLLAKRNEIHKKIGIANNDLGLSVSTIEKCDSDIKKNKAFISSNTELMKKLQEQYKAERNERFNESTTICPTCNRKLDEDKISELMEGFESKKKKRLEDIATEGNELKKSIETMTAEIKELEQRIEKSKVDEAKYLEEKKTLETELSNFPDKVDLSSNEEYATLCKTIAEMEQEMALVANVSERRERLTSEIHNLRTELSEVEKRIASADTSKIEERIEELQKEQREVSQKVADQEKLLFLLEDFIRYKMNLISQNINDKFRVVTWKLFENQVNGGMKETCECMVNGVPYKDLNNGHKIIAGLDIIRTISELYGVSAPIFTDNAESINDFNIPEMDAQMILLKVSDDKELRMEVL